MKDKQRWNYFNQLFPFKFKSKADYQNNYQKYLSVAVLMNFCSDNFLKIILTTHLWQILFQYNFMLSAYSSKTFRRMRLKYKKYLRRNLPQTLKQHSDYKGLIAKAFDENRFKMKAATFVQVMKNKTQCYQLCLDRTYTLVLSAHSLCAQSSPIIIFLLYI